MSRRGEKERERVNEIPFSFVDLGLWDFKYQHERLWDWLALIGALQRPALLYLFWSLPERQFKSNQQLL